MNRARVNLPGRWGRYLCTLSHAVHTCRSRSWVGAGPGIAPGAGPLSSGLGAEWHVLEVGVRSQQPEVGCGARVLSPGAEGTCVLSDPGFSVL